MYVPEDRMVLIQRITTRHDRGLRLRISLDGDIGSMRYVFGKLVSELSSYLYA